MNAMRAAALPRSRAGEKCQAPPGSPRGIPRRDRHSASHRSGVSRRPVCRNGVSLGGTRRPVSCSGVSRGGTRGRPVARCQLPRAGARHGHSLHAGALGTCSPHLVRAPHADTPRCGPSRACRPHGGRQSAAAHQARARGGRRGRAVLLVVAFSLIVARRSAGDQPFRGPGNGRVRPRPGGSPPGPEPVVGRGERGSGRGYPPGHPADHPAERADRQHRLRGPAAVGTA